MEPDFLEDLVDFLLASTELTDVVGQKIHVDSAKETAQPPRVLLLERGGDVHEHLEGESGTTVTVIDFYTFGTTWQEARRVWKIIKDLIAPPFRQVIGAHFVHKTTRRLFRSSGYDRATDASDFQSFWTRQQWSLVYSLSP